MTLQDIVTARHALRDVIHKTDLVPSRVLSDESRQVFLKSESLQQTGSFKARGAYVRLAALTEAERARGIIAASAGNHAQGVALAAAKFGVPATIVMPEGAPLAKVSATRALRARVVLQGAGYDDAYKHALALQQETGAVFIHPFDDPLVIAGQGSVGLEILEDLPDVDVIVAPVGGGGLIAGVAVAAKALRPQVRVVGVEAAGAASMGASLLAGRVVTLARASTIADGIAVRTPGQQPFAICRELVDEMVTVDDDEIAQAILLLMERCKIVTEGAGAAAVAAILGNKFHCAGKVVAVLSGGNIDVTMLANIIDKGLLKAGRRIRLRTVVEDKPGRLNRLLQIVSDCEANVVSIQHDRAHPDAGIGYAMMELMLETQDSDHVARVLQAAQAQGFRLLES
ncbi:MAG: threonine ammonia-lyase [Oscillospiraceae bacterium]|nr:threonine ammonia-lyase [Oscillospiraceae bacterium]